MIDLTYEERIQREAEEPPHALGFQPPLERDRTHALG